VASIEAEQAGASALGAARGFPAALRIVFLQIAVLVALLAAWELAIRFGWLAVYIYGQPSGVFAKAVALIANGELLRDAAITAWESIAGFVLGTLLGSAVGLALWLSPTSASVSQPYLVALNGLPKIALAPLIIVWFGIGISSKIAIAAIITFIVSVITALHGAKEVDADLVKLMRSLGASRWKTWRTVIIPGAMPWIVSALRLNVGFALIGAVSGEYIASKEGLGYMIYYAGVLYDLNAVWVGIAALMAVALLMYGVIDFVERYLRP
jgi:NitT/TauT family transport system permease protein